MRWLVALALAVAVAYSRASADEAHADRAFHDAQGKLDALEALGAERPVTRWTDDAWSEAARLAERAGDFQRAKRDLEAALAVSTDQALSRRAHAELARLAAIAGDVDPNIAAHHEQLVERIAHGDPKPALVELAALVDANPTYPRAAQAMLAIGRGWERDGNVVAARTWFERADRLAGTEQTTAELVRFLIRAGALDEARAAIGRLHDRGLVGQLDAQLARAASRRTLRWMLWALVIAIGIAAAAAVRRDAGSWRLAGRRLLKPPVEAWFFVPIAIVLVVVAATGNPLVARGVRAIAIAGAVVAWISGAMLEGARPIGARRAIVHAAVAAVAVAAATYLAIDHDRMLDLVIETWRSGPAAR